MLFLIATEFCGRCFPKKGAEMYLINGHMSFLQQAERTKCTENDIYEKNDGFLHNRNGFYAIKRGDLLTSVGHFGIIYFIHYVRLQRKNVAVSGG